MDLDRIDFALLAALQNDARLSNKELAAHVDLAPSTCLERVRRLRAEGALLGAHHEVADEALGIGVQALVHVQLTRHSRDVVEEFESSVFEVDEVIAVYHVTGEHDFLLHVVVADPEHLRALLLDRFTTRDEVARVQTQILFSHRRKAVRPNFRDTDAEGGRRGKIWW